MSRKTFSQLKSLNIYGLIQTVIASFGSGKNEDGTDFSLSVDIGNVTLSGADIEIGAVEGKDGVTDARWKIKTDGTDNALVVMQNTSPLPTGAATGAKQDTGNTSLASIDTKLSGTGAVKDNGPAWTPTRTYTASADMTAAAAITAAPTSGQKILADDILISSDTAMDFSIQMETSANVLAKVFIPANGTVQITLRDGLKGDAADKRLFGKASVAGNVAITTCFHSEV